MIYTTNIKTTASSDTATIIIVSATIAKATKAAYTKMIISTLNIVHLHQWCPGCSRCNLSSALICLLLLLWFNHCCYCCCLCCHCSCCFCCCCCKDVVQIISEWADCNHYKESVFNFCSSHSLQITGWLSISGENGPGNYDLTLIDIGMELCQNADSGDLY